MTLSEWRRLRVSIVTLGVIVIGAACADHASAQTTPYQNPCTNVPASSCVNLTLNANVQVTNLHPAVNRVVVSCAIKTGEPNVWVTSSNRALVASNSFFGNVSVGFMILKSVLAPLNNKLDTVCELRLSRLTANGTETELPAVASAAQPQAQTDTNWNVVTTNSAIKWTRTVLFGAANP